MAYSRLEQLKIRLRQSDVSCEQEDKFLEQLLYQSEQDVRLYRNYPDNYTEEMIETSKEQQKNNKGTSKAHKQERKNEKNVRNYNNFERRKYDMDSLESKLMEVNMNGKINKA